MQKKTPHPHHVSMALYAQDCATDGEAWKDWQLKCPDDGKWYDLVDAPQWDSHLEYRRKPFVVNGREVPAPLKEAPSKDILVFLPSLVEPGFFISRRWFDAASNSTLLERGLVHLSSEAAATHAKAMLNID